MCRNWETHLEAAERASDGTPASLAWAGGCARVETELEDPVTLHLHSECGSVAAELGMVSCGLLFTGGMAKVVAAITATWLKL